MRSKRVLLGELELEVMKAVWDRSEASASDIVEALSGSQKLHANTVTTVLNRLAAKGLLERLPRDGRSSRFRAKISREEMSRAYIDIVARHFFGGSTGHLAAALLGLRRRRP